MDGTLVNFSIDSKALRLEGIKYLKQTLEIPDGILDVKYNTMELVARTKTHLQKEGKAEPDWAKIYAEIFKIAEKYEDEAAEISTAMNGITDVLMELKASGIHMAVCTFNSTRNALQVLERNNLASFFDSVVGRDKVPDKTKPNPAHGRYILDELGVHPKNACIIGDHPNDIEMAFNMGCKGIAITSERHGPADFARFKDVTIVSERDYHLLAHTIKNVLGVA